MNLKFWVTAQRSVGIKQEYCVQFVAVVFCFGDLEQILETISNLNQNKIKKNMILHFT